MLFHGFGGSQNQCRCAVVYTRGVAGSNSLIWSIDRFQFGQGFERCIGARMLILADYCFTLLVGNPHLNDFFSEKSCSLRSGSTLLTAQSESVLIFAGYLEIVRNVVGSLRHCVDAVLRFHQRVDETPANGSVFQFHVARERRIRLAHHERRAGHRLDAAGNRQLHFAAGNGAERSADGIHARSAQAIEGHAGNGLRQACQQQRHARHVAVVFAGLVGAAEEYLVHRAPVDRGITFHQCLDRHRSQIVGADCRQAATEAADRCANRVADIHITHHASPGAWPWAAAVRASRSLSAFNSTAVGSAVCST